MQSMVVAIIIPCANLHLGLSQQREQRLIEMFISEAAVEASDEAVLRGLSRR